MEETFEIIEENIDDVIVIEENLEIISIDGMIATDEEVWERLELAFGEDIIASQEQVQEEIERSFV